MRSTGKEPDSGAAVAAESNLNEQDHRAIAGHVFQMLAPELTKLMERSAAAPAPMVPLGRPPATFDGIDAQSLEGLRSKILDDFERLVRRQTEEFLPEEEIDKRIKSAHDSVNKRFDDFEASFNKVHQAIVAETQKMRDEFYDFAQSINLPLGREDKKERQESLETLRGIVASFKGGKAVREEIRRQAKVWFWGWVSVTATAVGTWFATRLFGGPSH